MSRRRDDEPLSDPTKLVQPKGGLTPEADVEWVSPFKTDRPRSAPIQAGKGGQFSQLTVPGFGPRDIKPTDEHRWPQGHSPERRREVQERVRIVQHNQGRGDEDPNVHPWSDTRGNETPGRMYNLGKQRVIGAIARSSVPVENIRNPRNDPTAPFWSSNRLDIVTGAEGESGAAGWFGPVQGSVHVGQVTRRYNETKQEEVLLHEMGHAASHLHGTEHSVKAQWEYEGQTGEEHPMSESVRHGREEAFADNYAIEHRGARRGEELPRFTSPYEKPGTLGETYGLSNLGSKQADAEYREARTPVPHAPKVKPAGTSQFHEAPLFGRNADAIRTRTEKDFGQFGWFSNAERNAPSIDSIRVGQGPPERSQEIMQAGHRLEDVDLIAGHSSHLQNEYLTAVERGDAKKAADAVTDAKARDKERW